MTIRLASHIRRSRLLLRKEALLLVGLSLCLHVSFVASVCGLGLVAGPWFACELVAFQLLGFRCTVKIERDRGWFAAAGLFLGLQLLILTGVAFAWIGLSTSAPLEGASVVHDSIALRPLLVFASTLVVCLGVTIPLTFVPHHLLSRRVSALQALGNGLRDVSELGFFGVYRMVFVTQLLQLSPFLLMAVFVTWIWGREAIPIGVLLLVPLQMVLLPLAQSVVSSVYAQRFGSYSEHAEPARWLDVLTLALPVALCLLSVLSLLQPAPLPHASRFDGTRVFDSSVDGSNFVPPGSDLSVELDHGVLALEVSDGGGAGQTASGVRSVVIEERSDAFVAKLQTRDGARALHFDRAGIRLDDSLSDRLAGHVPEWFFVLLMLAMIASTWAVYRRKPVSVLCALVFYDLFVVALVVFR